MGCLGCEDTYEIGSPQCPHCGTRSPMYVRSEEEQMPTITSGGASNAGEAAEAATVEGVAAEAPAEVDAAPEPTDAEVTAEPAGPGTDYGSVSPPADAETAAEAAPEASGLAWVGEPGPELVKLPAGNTLSAEQVAAWGAPVEPGPVEAAPEAAPEAVEPEAGPQL